MIEVVPDSNVWVSAFNFGGVPRRIVEMGLNEHLLRLPAFTKTSILKPSDLARRLRPHGGVISSGF